MCSDTAATTPDGAAAGPFFRRVDTVTRAELDASGEDATLRATPLLVKGATSSWPAARLWDFEYLGGVCGCAQPAPSLPPALVSPLSCNNSDTQTQFYNGGPAEQGATLAPLTLPVGPYLSRLGALPTAPSEQSVVLPLPAPTADGAEFALNWRFAPKPREPYLAQWSILDSFPQLRADLRVRQLWPSRLRLVWEHVFLGPAGTVTGLHYDWNPNIFTNVRGVKDWILFPAGQDHALQPSRKFDWGATCSSVDVSRLAAMPSAVRERFVAARGGWYARVEAGDALIVPPGTWHAVVARTPCISVSAFGLTVLQVLTNGVYMTLLAWAHALGLYRRGNCTCCLNTAAGKKSD